MEPQMSPELMKFINNPTNGKLVTQMAENGVFDKFGTTDMGVKGLNNTIGSMNTLAGFSSEASMQLQNMQPAQIQKLMDSGKLNSTQMTSIKNSGILDGGTSKLDGFFSKFGTIMSGISAGVGAYTGWQNMQTNKKVADSQIAMMNTQNEGYKQNIQQSKDEYTRLSKMRGKLNKEYGGKSAKTATA